MKRILSFLLVAILTFSAMMALDLQGSAAFAFSDEPSADQAPAQDYATIEIFIDNVTARVNGTNVALDQPATVLNGRTVVPARFIAENLGASVGWDELSNKVTITWGGTTLEIFIDNPTARVNGTNVALDQPATVLNGRTVVPARFVAENLGATVGWDELENKVTITGTSYIGSSIRTYTDVTGVELYFQADGTETMSQYVYTYAADELEQYFAYLEDAGYQMKRTENESGLLTLTYTNTAYKGADELMLIIYNPENASFSIFIFNK